MPLDVFNQGLMSFLKYSPTPFHAVSNMVKELLASGFVALDESLEWELKPHGRYFVTRNGSSLIAFTVGQNPLDGIRMVGGHTDSPCLKVKPTPEVKQKGFSINDKAAMMLSDYLGNDLSRISNEVDKLAIVLEKGTKITDKHIEENIGISKDYNIFELTNAIAEKDILKANRIIYYFEHNPKAGNIVPIIANLFGYYQRLLKVHFLPILLKRKWSPTKIHYNSR